MKSAQELIVITKTYDLILWTCNHGGIFPRSHRIVFGERIERSFYDLLEIPIKAKYVTYRQELLKQANLTLEVPRSKFRIRIPATQSPTSLNASLGFPYLADLLGAIADRSR